MTIWDRLNAAMKGLWGGGSSAAAPRSAVVGSGGLRSALMQGQAGSWASDHKAETDHFTGWNYIAIRAIALQAAQAQVLVFQDEDVGGDVGGAGVAAKRRQIRKSLFRKHGVAKSLELIGEDQSPLPQDHRLCRLMKRPNPYQSGASFRYEQVVQLSLTGTCLVWNVPNQAGLTVERYVVPTAAASPIMPTPEHPRGAWQVMSMNQWAVIRDAQGFVDSGGFGRAWGAMIPGEQMQVVRWPHPLRKDDGYSSLSAGALMIDTSEQIDRARWYHLNNGPSPSLVVDVDSDSPEEVTRAQVLFNQGYTGVKNTGKAIFTGNAKSITAIGTNPKDMDYQGAFIQLRDSIMALHGVPGVAAGLTDGGSYAALYASITQFIRLTVQPYLSLIGEEETEQLGPQFGSGLTVEMEAAGIDDPTLLNQQLQVDVAARIRTVDEFRHERGLPPLGGEAGAAMVGVAPAVPGGPGMSPGTGGQSQNGNGDESTTGVAGAPGFATIVGLSGLTELGGKSHTPKSDRHSAIRSAVAAALESSATPDEVKAIIRNATNVGEYP
jgi:hypothetical protein